MKVTGKRQLDMTSLDTGKLFQSVWEIQQGMADTYRGLWAWEKEDNIYWEHLFTAL